MTPKPFWLPDTQGFLAMAIILLIAVVVLILILHPPVIDERTSGVLMTIVGVLIACLKDVYSFFFGSSKGSEKKDDALISGTITPTTPAPSPSSSTAKAVAVVAAIVMGAFVLVASAGDAYAEAQIKKPAVTGNIVKDIRTDLGISDKAGVTKNEDGSIQCDFNIFLLLNPKNLKQVIKACVTDANSTLAADTETALASAQAFDGGGDQTAIQCLKPGLAIIQAGIAKPAIVAVPEQPATATTSAISAVAAVPAYNPGLVTLFQKFREFVLAGGPTACQNWIQGTVNGAVQPAVAGVAGAAGLAGAAAILAPIK